MVMNKINNGLKSLDKQAYNIVCDWHKAINFNPIFQGIDYSLIIRFYLWDKVGRALRLKYNLSSNEAKVYNSEPKPDSFYHKIQPTNGKFRKTLFKTKKIIFIPFPGDHTKAIVNELINTKKYRIISKRVFKLFPKKNVIRNLDYKSENEWSTKLYSAIIKGLKKLEVELMLEDFAILKSQIFGAVEISKLALIELKKYKPDALYVHTDNHPPFINYILAAKQLSIPTFMYQHGLDCEYYYLDDCFASYVGVWSDDRKAKYQEKSNFQPKKYQVVGNIFLDSIIKKDITSKNKRKKILFITRPHKSIKCYSPSRNYLEGINILKVILDFFKTNRNLDLVIKPHPMDNFEEYRLLIESYELNLRAKISTNTLTNLFAKVDIVITEDSTGGAEAMRYSLPCIHAHFADSEPILPFVSYKAALPAKNEKELLNSLEKALLMSETQKQDMSVAQSKLVEDLMPNGELKELIKFIDNNI